jgi:hypothetical protein
MLLFIVASQSDDNYCSVTGTKTIPLPSAKPVMALPRIAPAKAAESLSS